MMELQEHVRMSDSGRPLKTSNLINQNGEQSF